MQHTTKMVLIRHGESKWNKENRFTGWYDIDLSERGIKESKKAGILLKKRGFTFDIAYTSVLKRAIYTLWNILIKLDQVWIPVKKSWRLNERHYGALQGLNKEKITKQYGSEKVNQWRRGFSSIPPKISKDDKRYPGFDMKYAKLEEEEIPLSESLELTFKRIVPYWKKNIFPHLEKKENVIISAHGNSLRALVKHLNNMDEEEIIKLNIPTGIPLVYEFNQNNKIIEYYYLEQ